MSPIILQILLVAAAGVLLAVVVARLTRLRMLSFRFSLGWMMIALVAILASVLIPLVAPIATMLRVTPAALLTVGATAVVVAITLQLSISVSGIQNRVRDLTEAHALATSVIESMAPTTASTDGVLVVVPAWNEAANVVRVVEDVVARGYPVLVVDDASEDRTTELAAAAGATVLRLPINLGVGGALRAGFRYAVDHGFDRIARCDGDGQHPTERIPELLAVQESEDADLVVGSRFAAPHPGMRVPRLRRLTMGVLARSATRAVGTRLTDTSSGFLVIRRPLLDEFARELPSHYLGDTYEAVVAAGRAGYRVRELPVPMRERAHGTSSASTGDAIRFTIRAFTLVVTRSSFTVRSRDAALTG